MGFENFMARFSKGFIGGMLYGISPMFQHNPFFSYSPFFNTCGCGFFRNNSILYTTPYFGGCNYLYPFDLNPPSQNSSYSFINPAINLNFEPPYIESIWDDPPEFLKHPYKYYEQNGYEDSDFGDIFTSTITTPKSTAVTTTQTSDDETESQTERNERKTKTQAQAQALSQIQSQAQANTSSVVQTQSAPIETVRPSTTAGVTSSHVSSNPEKSRTRRGSGGRTWAQMTDEEMKQIYGNYDRDITDLYTGTAEQLNKYLADKGVLKGKGEAFMAAQRKYNISASVLVGLCVNESGKGTSRLARQLNNVAGIKRFYGNGKWEWRRFNSVDECIDFLANKLNNNYVQKPGKDGKVKHLTKLYQINAKYCPVGDEIDNNNLNPYWARNIENHTRDVERIA